MPSTPHLVADLDVLERNIADMATRGRALGVDLRPHVKTHKIPQIGHLQLDAGARGVTVATIGEAEVFADAGFDDLLIAYPLWVDAESGGRLRALAERVRIIVGCDSAEAARNLKERAGALNVLLEVDSGHHRTGVRAEGVATLAERIAETGHTVVGVFTFPGHSYGPDARATAAAAERDTLADAVNRLRNAGFTCGIVSGGSSPSMAFATTGAMTELRPGAYVFNDAQQWELGACDASQIALTVHATVVSHGGGRVVLDAGSKAVSPDKAAWATGAARLLDHPDARVVQLSEHHAVVDMAGAPLPHLGSTVRVVPNHCCNAVNLADAVTVHRNGQVVDIWPVAARGRNA